MFITGYFPYRAGGAEYQAYFLANRLKNNADISFIMRDHWGKKSAFKNNGFNIYPVSPVKVKGVSQSFIFETTQIKNILKQAKPDVIYVRGANAYLGIAAKYAQKNSCRLIWHIASDNDVLPFQATSLRHALFAYIDKKAIEYGMRRADYIIAQTSHQAILLERNYKLQCRFIVGNWHSLPSDYIKTENLIRVVWIANWKPIKQPEIFIQLAKLLYSVPNVSFTMLGRTKNYSTLKKEAIKAGIDVKGEIPNEMVNQMLEQDHILINTSKQEGFSNTFIQAWMRRVPVISLQVDPDNVLQKEGIGFCSGNFENLVKDTRKLINDNVLRNAMGADARIYATKNHSLKNMDRIIDLFYMNG